ncbi:O-methyltransferase [bacterium]|nr:O-methyltransferase [bacterium]
MRSSNDSIAQYVESLNAPRSATLVKIAEQLKKDSKWGINIGAVEAAVLQFLIKSHGIKSILEIGTQYGYSTQWMLEALPTDGRLISLEKDPSHHQMAKTLVTDSRVTFLLGDAEETLSSLDSQFFDLIFIDANKKSYPDYLTWAESHVRSGGLIIGDNTFLFGQVYEPEPQSAQEKGRWKAMRQFNERLFKNPNFTTCLIPTSEGLTVAIKK